MRRRVVVKQSVSPSLFPFLAVLLCTMGALIALLVLVVQQARVQATAIMENRSPEQLAAAKESVVELDEQLWRIEIFEKQRAKKTEELAESRLELSHLEEHILRLQEKWESIKRQVKAFQDAADSKNSDQEQLQAQLDKLQAQLQASRKALEKAKREAAGRKPSFAIIPYKGSYGTQRRPIFIECTADGVVIQPEGIVLAEEDFEGPLGPGNPLDAALRAIREYWARFAITPTRTEPYPLIVVRPDGVEAYAAARAAIKNWDDEFGYELIDADLELAFPPADPRLAETLRKTVELSRRRQQALIAAMPGQFSGVRTPAGGLVASRGGGFAPEGGGFGSSSPNENKYGAGAYSGRGSSQVPGSRFGAGEKSDRTQGNSSSARTLRNQGSNSQQGNSTSQANGPNSASQSMTNTMGSAGRGGPQSHGSADARTAASGSSGANQKTDSTSIGQQRGVSVSAGQMQNVRALAETRGPNWGLPNATRGAVGVARPLSVTCLENQLILQPSRGGAWRRVVTNVDGAMKNSIDEFVSEVWKRINNWGIALPGGYWKPELIIEVAPGAEYRFRELEILLEGSGLDLKRRRK